MIGDRRERYHAAENIWKKEYESAGRLRLRVFDLLTPSWTAERDPIPYALETDWLAEAGGFEPLHFGIRSAAVDHGL